MNKKWLFLLLVVFILVFSIGCKKVEKGASDTKEAAPKKVAKLDSELSYCTDKKLTLEGEVESIGRDIEDTKQDIEKIEAEMKEEPDDEDDMKESIEKKNEDLESSKEELSNKQSELSDFVSGCNKLEKGDKAACEKFLADMEEELAKRGEELMSLQKELQYYTEADDIQRQQRKILEEQQIIDSLSTMQEEIQAVCE